MLVLESASPTSIPGEPNRGSLGCGSHRRSPTAPRGGGHGERAKPGLSPPCTPILTSRSQARRKAHRGRFASERTGPPAPLSIHLRARATSFQDLTGISFNLPGLAAIEVGRSSTFCYCGSNSVHAAFQARSRRPSNRRPPRLPLLRTRQRLDLPSQAYTQAS